MKDDELLKRLDDRDKEVSPGNLYGLAAARIRELEAERDEAVTQMIEAKVANKGVADGTHVIVPVEPTDEMAEAGDLYSDYAEGCYRAMIRAYQTKPQQGE